MQIDLLKDPHVCVDPWVWADDKGSAKEMLLTDKPDGYVAYVRGPTDDNGGFDMSWEMDFLDETSAMAYAARLAVRFNTIISVPW